MPVRSAGAAVALVLALVVVAVALAAVPAAAQQGISELRGRCLDQQNAVLPGVTIVVRNQDTGMYRETLTNPDGSYFVTSLTPGVYEISATLEGFKKYGRRDVRLELGRTTSLDIQLEVGSREEVVTVTGEAPLVDVTSKAVGGNISSRELSDLPSVNRNFIGFVGLLPGIVPNISTESFGSDSVSVNGQDSRNNNYMLDGANNNDDVIGQRAGTQARTPLESVQEFQVLTNQFDAQFGRTTGAVINAITKQGTNQFRGSAFGYFQGQRLTQRDYFAEKRDLSKPDTQQQQYGGTLGGPIIKDKAHFFLSLERVLVDRGTTINIPARPEFNQTTTTLDRVWNTMIRFDHQVSANHTWGVRWLREQSPQKNQIVGTVTADASREETDVDQTVVWTMNSVLGNTKVNTLRMAWTRENVTFANPGFNGNGRRQDLLPATLTFLTFTDQQSSTAQARINDAFQVEETFSWFVPGKRGDHDIKFGVQYQYSGADNSAQDNYNGTFSFSNNGPFNAGDPRTYPERLSIRVPGPLDYYLKAHFFSVFAQDKWRATSALTLSAGARYDIEKIPMPSLENPLFAAGQKPPVDMNNVSPRVGFTYNVGGGGRTVLRGGYGLFFDKTHFELITAAITSGIYSNSFVVTFPANAADPGPSQGRLPTDPFLANGPVVNRALLDQLYPPGSKLKNTGNVFLDNPNRRVPYTHQLSLGLERQFGTAIAVSADYVRGMGRDQFMTKDLNPGLRVNTSRTGTVVRVDPAFRQSVNERVNAGRLDYDALQVQVQRRFQGLYSARVSYTLSYSRGNTSGNGIPSSNYQLLDDMRLDLNEGPTDFDRRHNLVFSGSLLVPGTKGLNISAVARYLSGLPFTISDSNTDPDRNGILFDPLPAGDYSGTGDADAISVSSDGGRNGARGPDFLQVDMRFGYRIPLPGLRRATLDVYGELFNLANRANFDNPSGDRRSTSFLVLTALRAGGIPRTGQLGVRFAF
jgi:hypothetical protein